MTLRDLRTALCSPVSGVKRPGPSQSCQGLFNYGVEFNYGVNSVHIPELFGILH